MFREEQNPVLDIAPGVTAMNIVRKRRIKKNKEVLPSLKSAPEPTRTRAEAKEESLQQAVEKKRNNSVALSNSTSSEASIRSYSGLRLQDDIATVSRARNFEYTTAHLLNGISEDSDSLAVKHQPRSKSAHDMLDEPFERIQPTGSSLSQKTPEKLLSRQRTQTTIDLSDSVATAIATQTEHTIPIFINSRRKSEAYKQRGYGSWKNRAH
ncbi:unnamed protein product, partial [Mesorhabditis spiculigera]